MGALLSHTILLGVFAVTAYKDWREKCIYLYVPVVSAMAGMLLHLLYQENSLTDMLFGAGVGGLVLFIAWISGESIGVGDGMMLIVSGLFLGFWANLELLLTALLLVGAAALFLVVVRRKERSYRVPFLPFLFAAYLLQLV